MQSGNTAPMNVKTTAVLRDPSAWYHLVFALDTTQATASDRFKIYINGIQATNLSATTYPALNAEFNINNTTTQYLGRRFSPAEQYFDGYMAEVHFTDGTAYTADAFGEFKNGGVWVAKTPSVTYGTNGFYLDFQDDTEVEAFNTVLYTGNGSTAGQSVTGMGFAPDLIWLKSRSASGSHMLNDTVRGAGNMLLTNATNAEETGRTDKIESLDSDGFTIGSENNDVNQSGKTFVVWGWKAGDSNVSNTDGSITSTVRANDTYGFSIVSWTASGTPSDTIGHGLSSAPKLIIVKDRDSVSDWCVYSETTGAGAFLKLNDTAASTSNTTMWNNTSPTSSVFNWGYSGGNDIIAYCWAEKTGYSKFGSYTGNGSTDGPEVTLGFKPAFLLVKNTTYADQWWILVDNTRSVSNPVDDTLFPNISNAEQDNDRFNFTDTGFKVIQTYENINRNGDTFIYAAFADTREAAFWLDQSGNDNDWQPVNLDHNDTVADSPTNNFATMNPLQVATSGAPTFSNGNLEVSTPVSGVGNAVSTIGVTSGKYYAEVTVKALATLNRANVGITGDAGATITANTNIGSLTSGLDVGYFYNGKSFTDNVETSGYGDSYGVGDVIGIALNVDDSEVTFYKNGTSQGAISFTSGGTYHFAVGDVSAGGGNTFEVNFGQQPFKYDPPA